MAPAIVAVVSGTWSLLLHLQLLLQMQLLLLHLLLVLQQLLRCRMKGKGRRR